MISSSKFRGGTRPQNTRGQPRLVILTNNAKSREPVGAKDCEPPTCINATVKSLARTGPGQAAMGGISKEQVNFGRVRDKSHA